MNLRISNKVYIHRCISDSGYYKKNKEYLSEPKAKIGTSIRATREMMSSHKELEVYMPILTGFSPNHPDWNLKITNYFDSICVRVPEVGLTLETGFEYNNEEAYNKFTALKDEIEGRYQKGIKELNLGNPVDKAKEGELFKRKYEELIELERSHYNYGRPLNVADYILWRHCLVYGGVANREEDIDKSPNIRFFIHDPESIKRKDKEVYNLKLKATQKYHEIIGDVIKLKQVIRVYNENVNLKGLSVTELGMQVDGIVNSNPSRFLDIIKDKDLPVRALIHELLTKKLLRRIPNSNTIVDRNNDILGNNMADVVIWFKNEKNRAAVSELEAQLKSLPEGNDLFEEKKVEAKVEDKTASTNSDKPTSNTNINIPVVN